MPKLKSRKKDEPDKSSRFSRGYGEVRQKISKKSKFTMSCYNCEHYYQDVGDKEEVCQNPDVLSYDMVVNENTVYCSRWEMVKRQSSAKSIFKRS